MSTVSSSQQTSSPARPKALLRRLTSSNKHAKSSSSSSTFSSSSHSSAAPAVTYRAPPTKSTTATTAAAAPSANGPDLSNLPLPLPTLVVGSALVFVFALVSRAFYTFSTSLLRAIVLVLTLAIGVVLLGGWEKRAKPAGSGASQGRGVPTQGWGAAGPGAGAGAAPPPLAPPPLINGNLVSPYSYASRRAYSSY
ncbi:hypothetical protein FA10DRAFT_303108 [Acaromyces ingoldii]|uniref:Uncharacterized protein n=1 Tax=Acaromyces ingoldii TaxID=215250 RepID=A0A316YG30_9BASI|nr:hypothetical protein FA10DRAFT_303108 [Acaromyces ingoldii]PWN88112.1 hypothetical protein FA10DRAFT_303108 [Acaromyces ingoldii]